MSDNGSAPSLTIGHGSFLFWDGARLPVRYVDSKLEFIVKDKRQWAKHGKRIRVPLESLEGLERKTPARSRSRMAAREFRAMEKAASVSPRNKLVDKTD